MLAHFFLWHLQIRLGKKAPALTVSQVRRLLAVVLPLKVFQADEVLRCNVIGFLPTQTIYSHPEVGTPAVRGVRGETTQKRLNDVGYRQESESVHRDLSGLR